MQCRWKPPSSLLLTVNRRNLSTHAPVVLRPYQEVCLTSCTDALAGGSTRLGVSLPTGSGKTVVFVSLLSRIAPPSTNTDATRALIVVNSIELARQSAEQVRRMFPHWEVEIEQGTKYRASGMADVTIATYQTLNNEQRLMKFDNKRIKAIIIDEAHHAAAPSYRRLLSRFDPDIKHPDGLVIDKPPHKIPIIGFSATFSRHDKIALGSVFEQIVYHRDFMDMIDEQWLCDIRFTSVEAELTLSEISVNPVSKDFNAPSLAVAMNSTNDLVVRSWMDRASERKSTLVFCVNVSHVIELTETFRKYGIDARYLYSATPHAERKELVSAFKNGDFPVLVNCAVLTEGADIPNIDCVVLARPTRSRNIFAQMVGRGMRLSPDTGKKDCRIIDFVDVHSEVGDVVSVPSLFGLNPKGMSINDETIASLKDRISKQKEAFDSMQTLHRPSLTPISKDDTSTRDSPNPFSITYTDHDDLFGKAEQLAGTDREIMSLYAWVHCGRDVWVLELMIEGFILVEPVNDMSELRDTDTVPLITPGSTKGTLFKASYMPSNKNSSLARVLFSGRPLDSAIRACDAFVRNEVFSRTSTAGLRTNAPWRKRPASDAQRNLIISLRRSDPNVSHTDPLPLRFTKGQAAEMIAHLKHTAAGLHNTKKAEIQTPNRWNPFAVFWKIGRTAFL